MVSQQACVSACMPTHAPTHAPPRKHIHIHAGFSFSIHGQTHHRNEGDISWDKLHGHKLQDLLKVPKFRPERRDRWPVAHYSHLICEQLKLVGYPLSWFPLDSLHFYGIHWNDKRRAGERYKQKYESPPEPKATASMRRKTLAISCCALTARVWTLPPWRVWNTSSPPRDIMWAEILPRKYHWAVDVRELTLVYEAGLLAEEKLWPDMRHGNGKINRCWRGSNSLDICLTEVQANP